MGGRQCSPVRTYTLTHTHAHALALYPLRRPRVCSCSGADSVHRLCRVSARRDAPAPPPGAHFQPARNYQCPMPTCARVPAAASPVIGWPIGRKRDSETGAAFLPFFPPPPMTADRWELIQWLLRLCFLPGSWNASTLCLE